MSNMRKHAGRPGRSKWKVRLALCMGCKLQRWLDAYSRCKHCRRSNSPEIPEGSDVSR